MPHHRLPDKPRSLHRQLTRRTSLSSTSNLSHATLPSALEHSLDEWLSRNSSSSSNNSASSEKSNDPGFYGSRNGNHLTHSPTATTPRSRSSTSSLPQPRPSVSVPVTMHTDQHSPSSSQTSCPCCQLLQCQSWKKMSKVIRRLETETLLAAEIGQSLLQKNEAYLMESNQLKEQLTQCEDRKQELEISLDDTERLAQKLKHEKDKWMWQYEKSEKILNESVVDLENTNLKCTKLANDLEQTKLEMEKLELFKYNFHQSNTREDALRSKLEDTMQELVISRKTELTLESKYKKLLTRYESLSNTYQDLCKNPPSEKIDSQHVKPLPPSAIDIQQASTEELVTFIKELLSTNNDLKSILLSTSIQLNDTRNEINFSKDNHDNTIQGNQGLLEKQPNRLAGDKHHSTITTIDNAKPDVYQSAMDSNSSRQHHSESSQSSTNETTPPTPQTTTSTPVVHHHYHYYLRQRQQNADNNDKTHFGENNNDIVSAYCDNQDCLDSTLNDETPRPLMSLPSDPFSLHINANMTNNDHHGTQPRETMGVNDLPTPLSNINGIQQHQHHGNNTNDYLNYVPETMEMNTINCDTFDNPTLTLSPSSSAPIPTKVVATSVEHDSSPKDPFMSPISKLNTDDSITSIKSTPYASLLDQAKSIVQRLHSTDARILNRQLQRAFDIGELSLMSNAIIQNIMADVDTIHSRFFWLTPGENDGDGGNENGYTKTVPSFLVNEFFDIVRFLQEILQEIGQLSITINHLQVAYVKKVEENEAHVERKVMAKYQSRTSASIKNNVNSGMAPSTNILARNPSTSSTASSTERVNVNPVNWLSNFFMHDFNNTGILTKKEPTYQRPTTISILDNSNITTTSTTTSPRTKYSRMASRKRLEDNHTKTTFNRKKSDIRRPQQQQQYHPDGFENQKHKKLWPSISSIMDEWNQTTIKHSFSSSLDREWLLDLH